MTRLDPHKSLMYEAIVYELIVKSDEHSNEIVEGFFKTIIDALIFYLQNYKNVLNYPVIKKHIIKFELREAEVGRFKFLGG
jgi:hypothetical protein